MTGLFLPLYAREEKLLIWIDIFAAAGIKPGLPSSQVSALSVTPMASRASLIKYQDADALF